MRYLIFLLALLFSFNTNANTDPCDASNSTYEQGELITYKLYYNWGYVWLSAGEVKFAVSETDDTYIIEAYGRTYPSYEWFFKVNDYFKSVIDKKTLLPIEFERSVEEGGYKRYTRTEFDQASMKATSYVGKNRESVTPSEYSFDQCMHDVLSSIYLLRNMNYHEMEEVSDVPLNLFIDDGVYPVNVHYSGKTQKTIKGLGKHNTLKLSPELVPGQVFEKGAEMNIWVSNDDNKIPLLIESPVSVGSLKAVLQSHVGLKYPLNSKA